MSADGKDTQEEQDYWPHRNYEDDGGGVRYEVPEMPKRQQGMYPITSWGAQVRSERNAAFGALINFCLPGIGVVYSGRTDIGQYIIIFWLVFAGAIAYLELNNVITNTMLFYAIFLGGYLLFFIGSAIMSSGICKENNELWYSFQDNLVRELQRKTDD